MVFEVKCNRHENNNNNPSAPGTSQFGRKKTRCRRLLRGLRNKTASTVNFEYNRRNSSIDNNSSDLWLPRRPSEIGKKTRRRGRRKTSTSFKAEMMALLDQDNPHFNSNPEEGKVQNGCLLPTPSAVLLKQCPHAATVPQRLAPPTTRASPNSTTYPEDLLPQMISFETTTSNYHNKDVYQDGISLVSSSTCSDWEMVEGYEECSGSNNNTIRPYKVLATKKSDDDEHSSFPPICSIEVDDCQDCSCVFRVSFERDPDDNVVELRGTEILEFCTALLEYHTTCVVFQVDHCTTGLVKQQVKPEVILSSLNLLLQCASSVAHCCSKEESAVGPSTALPPLRYFKPWQSEWEFEENDDGYLDNIVWEELRM